ncbi:MAG TPA: OmpH family outer membrane protein [Firmicutes bacterium]|nr:OmpH family outer membrane protein [Bacillota bacterium]
MIKYFTGKNRTAIVGGAALLVLIALGASLSMGKAEEKTTIGYVNSQRLIEEFLEPAVQEPLAKETDRLQKELDAEIAKLQIADEEAKLKEAQALRDKYQAVLDQKKQELIAPLLLQIRAMIQEVADARGITVVLDNTYGLILYGGIDLTDEVLKALQ